MSRIVRAVLKSLVFFGVATVCIVGVNVVSTCIHNRYPNAHLWFLGGALILCFISLIIGNYLDEG